MKMMNSVFSAFLTKATIPSVTELTEEIIGELKQRRIKCGKHGTWYVDRCRFLADENRDWRLEVFVKSRKKMPISIELSSDGTVRAGNNAFVDSSGVPVEALMMVVESVFGD